MWVLAVVNEDDGCDTDTGDGRVRARREERWE